MIKHSIKKFTRYEFWPFWVFYAPMFPVWIYYSLRTKHLTYFTAVNPYIKHGGFTEYSKFNIQKQLHKDFRPRHQLITKTDQEIKPFIEFPFIAKPDIGERGINVQIIKNQEEWNLYKKNLDKDIIIQELISLPEEYGIFYAKFPDDISGKILSITGKKFLTFVGDGKQSLGDFIASNSRAFFNKKYLSKKYKNELNLVLPVGESMVLEEIGNHNRGTYFFNHSDLISKDLELAINKAVSDVNGFYFGRLDVKSNSDESLKKGIFSILEVNGANSEATHIYDKNFSLVEAYREVLRHLHIQYKIAKYNIKKGIKPSSTISLVKAIYNHMKN